MNNRKEIIESFAVWASVLFTIFCLSGIFFIQHELFVPLWALVAVMYVGRATQYFVWVRKLIWGVALAGWGVIALMVIGEIGNRPLTGTDLQQVLFLTACLGFSVWAYKGCPGMEFTREHELA